MAFIDVEVNLIKFNLAIMKGQNARLRARNYGKSFIPSKALSISFCVGTGLFLRRVYIDITIPGVQNPHWEPWDLAIRSLISRKKEKEKKYQCYKICN